MPQGPSCESVGPLSAGGKGGDGHGRSPSGSARHANRRGRARHRDEACCDFDRDWNVVIAGPAPAKSAPAGSHRRRRRADADRRGDDRKPAQSGTASSAKAALGSSAAAASSQGKAVAKKTQRIIETAASTAGAAAQRGLRARGRQRLEIEASCQRRRLHRPHSAASSERGDSACSGFHSAAQEAHARARLPRGFQCLLPRRGLGRRPRDRLPRGQYGLTRASVPRRSGEARPLTANASRTGTPNIEELAWF